MGTIEDRPVSERGFTKLYIDPQVKLQDELRKCRGGRESQARP